MPDPGHHLLDDKVQVRCRMLSAVMNSLNEQRLIGQFCDVTLQSADGVKFKAHRNCLAAASEYFASMLNSGLIESKTDVIEMQGFDGETLEIVLQYIYVGAFEISFRNVLKVLNAFEMILLDFVISGIDAVLCYDAERFTKVVLEIATNFKRLPKTNRTLAKAILTMEHQAKRSWFIKRVNVEILCELLDLGGPDCNDFFPDILLWLKNGGQGRDVMRVYESLDFSNLYTTNLKMLVDFGLDVSKDKTNVNPIFRKTADLLIDSRSGYLQHTVKNLSTLSSPDFSELRTIGGLQFKLAVEGVGEKNVRDGKNFYKSLGIAVSYLPRDNESVNVCEFLVSYTITLFSKTGFAYQKAVTAGWSSKAVKYEYTCPTLISWDDLHDVEKGYVTDDSIDLEVHLVIEKIYME